MRTGVMGRLNLAQQELAEGELLLRERMGSKLVVAKFYHAMMYCLYTLFDIRDATKLTHADLIGRFDREYVRTGMIDGAVLEALHRAYDLTHECDCEHMPVPTREDIAIARRAAESLLYTLKNLLETEVER